MSIKVEKPTEASLQQKGVFSWPIWEKEAFRFDWHYDTVEECYLLEGAVTVETPDGDRVTFGKGDYVTFPKGLSCTWDISVPVRKHYRFK